MSINFSDAVKPLVHKPVGRVWKGYGSAIFLEIGQLTPETFRGSESLHGDFCISIEWDWRVELGSNILFGSSNSRPEIVEQLHKLENSSIQSIQMVGHIPELLISLSTGYRIHTMSMVDGEP